MKSTNKLNNSIAYTYTAHTHTHTPILQYCFHVVHYTQSDWCSLEFHHKIPAVTTPLILPFRDNHGLN